MSTADIPIQSGENSPTQDARTASRSAADAALIIFQPATIDTPTFDAAIKLAALVETKVGHELALIGQRMSWLVLSQSFLFVALTGAHGALATVGSVQILRILLPCVALWICLWVYRSLLAALRVERRMLRLRAALEDVIYQPFLGDRKKEFMLGSLPTERGEGLSSTLEDGARAPRFIPPMLILVWLVILIVEIWSVSKG